MAGVLIRDVAEILENPLGYPLAAEYEHFRKPMRRLLHRRTPSSVAYRVLFFVDIPARFMPPRNRYQRGKPAN